MDLLNLGSQSRKTGIRPRQNLRKDQYDMEDIDEFFSDEDDLTVARPSTTTKKALQSSLTPKDNFNNVAKKLNFDSQGESFSLSPISITSKFSTTSVKSKNKKSPLRSPLPEHNKALSSHNKKHEKSKLFIDEGTDDFNSQNDDDEFDYGDNFNDDDYESQGVAIPPAPAPAMSLSPVDISPVQRKVTKNNNNNNNNNTKASSRAASAFTKRLALGKSSKSKRKPVVEEEEEQEPIEIDQDLVDDENTSELISPPPTNKRKPRQPRTSFAVEVPSQQPTIFKPSPLPSPPPDGLRRSKRVKVAPIAYWRNERIVYSRADETEGDPDTTLATDIRKVPLQIIKEIVQMPELPNGIRSRAKRSRSRSRTTPPKSRKSTTKPVYDYESDPEIAGSEWFTKKELELNVFQNDQAIKQTVAYAPDGGNFEESSKISNNDGTTSFDKFKIASLFADKSATSAAGLLHFPLEGSKQFRNSGPYNYYFHVVRGLIEVTLNETTFVVTKGCSFEVPTRNSYGFKNIGQDVARLFFVQTKSPELENESGEEINDDDDWDGE
ncbi:Mif2/CENP-C like-domain-containing protein [Scheffersomyces coipomensis]|uniref:Mif2/CENP-C like-domain-containing protein n=1 Tax=Scheffersomyces coipomensis TaxID=1788519 RepID=UPI00315DDC74